MVARNASPEDRAAYLREWKARNPDKVRRSNREYARRVREAQPEREAGAQLSYYRANRDERLVANKEWRDRVGPDAPSRAKKAAVQDHTRASATRSRRRWTLADDVAVMADVSLAEVSLVLNRSRSAVEQRRTRLRKKGNDK